jgi:hypothetical protein
LGFRVLRTKVKHGNGLSHLGLSLDRGGGGGGGGGGTVGRTQLLHKMHDRLRELSRLELHHEELLLLRAVRDAHNVGVVGVLLEALQLRRKVNRRIDLAMALLVQIGDARAVGENMNKSLEITIEIPKHVEYSIAWRLMAFLRHT